MSNHFCLNLASTFQSCISRLWRHLVVYSATVNIVIDVDDGTIDDDNVDLDVPVLVLVPVNVNEDTNGDGG